MKPRLLLSSVDRLPTINEQQESEAEDYSSHTMEEYLHSIKELSTPAPYPLHGPLRGHRRWMARKCPPMVPSRTHTTWIPVELSDISFTFTDQTDFDSSLGFNQSLLDRLMAQSLFAGLV